MSAGDQFAYTAIIPAFNAAEVIAEAIDSILSQSLPPSAVIVVNDGSTDETSSAVKKFGTRIHLIEQPNGGCGAATNTGIDAVQTPLFACLDADDIWLQGKSRRQIDILAAEPGTDAVFGQVRQFHHGDGDRENGPVHPQYGRTTMMMRTPATRRIGPIIDPPGSKSRGDMIDWLARGREMGLAFKSVPDVFALRRIIPGSLSYGRDEVADRGYLHVVRSALRRKRDESR